MSDIDPIVQAVAEALHADQCPDDECDGGDMGEYERMAEIAVAVARPAIEREAKAAAERLTATLDRVRALADTASVVPIHIGVGNLVDRRRMVFAEDLRAVLDEGGDRD